jgi:hypothetical protein
MTIQQSIQRLSYTIQKGHKPNDTDKAALNKMIRDLNANMKETVQEHLLFAKLYAIFMHDLVIKFQDVNFANKQINKELEYPLDYHLEVLRLQLNRVEVMQYFKSKGVVDPSLNQDNFDNYKVLFPELNPAEFLEVAETWDTDNLNAHFTNSVNQSILCFKNSK